MYASSKKFPLHSLASLFKIKTDMLHDIFVIKVGGGVLGDVWDAEERGKAIAIYTLAPLLGPVIGPVCGGW